MCKLCGINPITKRTRCNECAEKQREKWRKYYDDRVALIREAKNKPCADCGVQYPHYVMQFDHRDPSTKLFNISRTTYSKKRVLEEIDKCDVVCANCYMERTWGGSREEIH